MKVIIVNDFGSVKGGASHVAITEALGIANRGHDVFYFYSIGPLDPRLEQNKKIKVISAGEFDLLTDPNRIKAGVKGIWNRQACKEMDSLLRKMNKADTIVHLHGWSCSLSPMIGKIIQRYSIPLVYTLHDYFIACPNGGFFNYPKKEICTLKALSPACLIEQCDSRVYSHKLWRYVRTWFENFAANIPNPSMDFIFVSDLSLQVIKPYLPEDAHIHKLFNPNPIPYSPAADITQNNHYTFIGQLSTYKGSQLLAEANQQGDFNLIFVGDGALYDTIQSIDGNATMTGWLEREGVLKQLNQARALIFPSRGYETQGLVVIEAASRGIPAIISDSCAATEYVEDGVTGLWFRHGDPQDLHDKIMMLQDNALLSRLGNKAFERYWKNPLLADIHTDELLGIYESVLSRASENQ